jgi:Flp pilus assembly protein TadG
LAICHRIGVVHRVRNIIRHSGGATATIFALATPLLVGGTTLAVDAASLVTTSTHLQGVADSTALAGAKELHLYRADYAPAEEGMRERALAMLDQQGLGDASPTIDVEIDGEQSVVTVTVEVTPDTVVLGRLGYVDTVAATAVAGAYGSTRLCVLALDETSGEAIYGHRGGSIEAAECAVQSNSPQPDGIELESSSSIEAVAICSSGGVEGPARAFQPEPTTDCPVIEDPIADQAVPAPGPCTYRNVRILLPRTISPGHYCGGLTLGPTALVRARPGEYIISGGPLRLGLASSLTGDGVSFRFVDEDSTFTFGLASIVQLSAPTEGPMAGFLFYQDPGIPKGQEFTIASDLVTKLLGTIYLPSGTLKIDVIGLIAAQSAYTVVVADRLDVRGANLVINSDYGATDVPVPAGVGPRAGEVVLSQ